MTRRGNSRRSCRAKRGIPRSTSCVRSSRSWLTCTGARADTSGSIWRGRATGIRPASRCSTAPRRFGTSPGECSPAWRRSRRWPTRSEGWATSMTWSSFALAWRRSTGRPLPVPTTSSPTRRTPTSGTSSTCASATSTRRCRSAPRLTTFSPCTLRGVWDANRPTMTTSTSWFSSTRATRTCERTPT